MSSATVPQLRSGLLLPPGVVQPFFLRFNRDDWHVMAFLDGHPAYEAVEAMVRAKAEGGWSIRAIITRHDQSQIDHVNDEALLAGMRGARREVTARDIDFAIDEGDGRGGRPRARLTFVSAAGERVALDLVAVGPPDTRGAGLTDPGDHSPDVSLPLMWRAASALAADGTSVTVAGQRYEAPAKVLRPGFTAREGFMTRGHSLGVIRAGQLSMKRLGSPAALEPGVERAFEVEGEDITYRIAARTADRALTIERLGAAREMISARPSGEQLELIRVSVPNESGLTLTFAGDQFEIGVEGNHALVGGRVEVGGDGAIITLQPETPIWAVSRPVQIKIDQAGDVSTVTTTVG